MSYQINIGSGARIAKFGTGVVIRARGSDPLDVDTMRRMTPSVFAVDKHTSRSERFTYVPTVEVLKALEKEDFLPFEVRQGGSRDVDKRGFTKHLIKLRQGGQVMRNVGDAIRELVLLNAHDGTSSYRLMSGVFRMVCSNGMVVADGEMHDVRIPHKGDIVGDVINAAYEIVDDGKRVDESMREMAAITLTRPEQEAFAESALHIRYGDEVAPIQPRQLLAPRRSADDRPDLWHTFNRVQENLVERGGISYMHRNEQTRRIQHRHTRPVNGIAENVKLNQALWTLAAKMAELKAA
jgi:Domain of unknown function (DUF932)